jgi:hypothetical protein
MQLTNKKIITSANALAVLSQVPLKVKPSFAVAKVGKGISAAIEVIQSEREKLVEKHAQRDDAGVRKVNPDGTIPLTDAIAFRADEAEFLGINQEIAAEPMDVEDLGDVSVPPAVFIDLDWLFAK